MTIDLPLRRLASRYALAFVVGVSAIGLLGAVVRVLPWALDASVPWAVVLPFARSIVMVALEAALLLGWPIGWGMAAQRFVESGEARVFALLGESPARTATRVLPAGVALACALALASLVGGRDAGAPGRVLTELVAEGRASCAHVDAPRSLTVPFLNATWLCVPGRAPRLVVPSPMGGLVVTASSARISGDFRRVELDDAFFGAGAAPGARVRVRAMSLVGLPPWSQSSILPPALRAVLVSISAAASAWVAMTVILARKVRGRVPAVVVSAVGPLLALASLRFIERRAEATLAPFMLVPLASIGAVVVAAWLSGRLRGLLAKSVTAST